MGKVNTVLTVEIFFSLYAEAKGCMMDGEICESMGVANIFKES